MSKVDWSLAPLATHLTDVSGDFYRPVFWRVVDGVALEAWSVNKDYTKVSDHYTYGPEGCLSYDDYTSIARPATKPWSGQEDGLPPVGIECEYGANEKWFPVKVIAHQSGGFYPEPQAVSQVPENGPLCIGTAKHFRAIKTAEQIAADNRETAIRELMDIAQVDCRVTAARLVDAGFKREGA